MRAIDPGDRAKLVTQADLAAVEARIDERMDERFASCEARMDERVTERLASLEARLTATFHQEMNRQIWTMIGSMLTLSAVLTANNLW